MPVPIKKKVAPFIENVAESGAACLITMVQGNVLALGVSHWVIASQTGVVAGTAAAATITLVKTDNRWAIAGILGVLTAVVDYFVHPGMFEPAAMEAIVTGVGAAILSFAAGMLLRRYRARRAIRESLDADLEQ